MRSALGGGGFFFLSAFCFSTTIYVPDDYPTIQAAIDASANGDTLIVRPATYVENIDFAGKEILLQSEQGAAVTVIDGNKAGSVVTFDSGEGAGSVLDGFTLTNGIGSTGPWGFLCGGGVYCSSSPTITNNRITANTAERGGGIYSDSGSPDITNNTISDNTVWNYGGGIGCFSGSTATISNNFVSGNFTRQHGGGIGSFSGSFPTITNNVIWNNTAEQSCGGIGILSNSNTVVDNNVIVHNEAYWGSGGIGCYESPATISNNRISENTAGDGTGGGIGCSSSAATITNNRISKNSADKGAGIDCAYSVFTLIVNNTVVENNANIFGGGIHCYDFSYYPPTVANNIVSGNTSNFRGGGICCVGSFPTLVNNTVSGNTATDGGGGISCDGSSPTVTNTILWANSAPTGKEIWISDFIDPSDVTIGSSDVEGGLASCYVESGCTLNWDPGMIDDDPMFVDAARDLHLTWNSPCRDMGDNSVVSGPLDFEGDPRITLGTVDMGADEFHYHLYHMGDVIPGGSIDLRIVGYPNAAVKLYLGSGLADPPYSTQHGDFFLQWPPLWQGNIGVVARNGLLTFPTTVPTAWTAGSDHPLQALVGPWNGQWTRLTNLELLTVSY